MSLPQSNVYSVCHKVEADDDGDVFTCSAMPLCKEVECPEPVAPENGFVSGNAPYKAGDLAQFDCNQGYMMEGQPIVACQDNGVWSRASTVKCKYLPTQSI